MGPAHCTPFYAVSVFKLTAPGQELACKHTPRALAVGASRSATTRCPAKTAPSPPRRQEHWSADSRRPRVLPPDPPEARLLFDRCPLRAAADPRLRRAARSAAGRRVRFPRWAAAGEDLERCRQASEKHRRHPEEARTERRRIRRRLRECGERPGARRGNSGGGRRAGRGARSAPAAVGSRGPHSYSQIARQSYWIR
jgi:hypothetical protein